MKFLIDENVSQAVLLAIKQSGYEVRDIREFFPLGVSDEEIFAFACKNGFILITRDFHFTNPIRFPTEGTPGIIFIRQGNLTSAEEANLIINATKKLTLNEIRHHLVIISKDLITVR